MGRLVSNLPSHNMYVELFSGNKSLLFEKPMGYAELYVEGEHDVTDLFAVLRMDMKRFVDFLATGEKPVDGHLVTKWDRFKDMYDNFTSSEYKVNLERETGFRDLTRELSREVDAIDAKLTYLIRRLRCVQLETRRFDDILKRFDTPNTLFYADLTRLPEDVTVEELVDRMLRVKGKGIIYGNQEGLEDLVDEGWYKVESIDTEDTYINF